MSAISYSLVITHEWIVRERDLQLANNFFCIYFTARKSAIEVGKGYRKKIEYGADNLLGQSRHPQPSH